MSTLPSAAAFFDIGNTLASVRVSATGDRILEMRVYPDALGRLEALRHMGVRLGTLSDPGPVPQSEVLCAMQREGLDPLFDRRLVLFGSKASPRLFERAAVAAQEGGHGGATLLFVGEDAAERVAARAAGFLTAPHPILALPVLQGRGPLRYLRIRVPPAGENADWRSALRSLPIVPLHLAVEPGRASPAVYAVADLCTSVELDDLGFWVDRLGEPDEPQTTDLYLFRDDLQLASGFLVPAGNASAFLAMAHAGPSVLTSTPEGLFVSFPGGLMVAGDHFERARHGHKRRLIASPALLEPMEVVPTNLFSAPRSTDVPFGPDVHHAARVRGILSEHIRAKKIEGIVDRFTGIQPVDGVTSIRSRQFDHPGNAEAVKALLAELRQILGDDAVGTHRFFNELVNVEARLPSTGPAGIVLIGAHLDSCSPKTGLAPGADDNASGIAAVLCAARAFRELHDTLGIPHREIRFVLFNAEEAGRIGSGRYAQALSDSRTSVAAVFCLDMIGHDGNGDRMFELHAGFRSSAHTGVHSRSAELAELVSRLRQHVSPDLLEPQVFAGIDDEAHDLSDHSSFQSVGYAACLATQDFFPGHGGDGDRNPHYHEPTDTRVDAVYAADIARVVAAAAWVAATR